MLRDPREIDGDPAEVALIAVEDLRREIETLVGFFPGVAAMVRNARLTQICEALDPRSVGVSPSPEILSAWEASTDASLLARIHALLDLLQRLGDGLYAR